MDSFKGTESRYIVTRKYCEEYIPLNSSVLDLGRQNGLTEYLGERYRVKNTEWNLDEQPKRINRFNYAYITSFEVFEHLLNPYSLLQNVKSGTELLCSVPLRVFFTLPYWNKNLDEDQHYHEFIPREFYKLLRKTGFEIKFAKKHCIVKNFGIRQIITGLFRFKRYLFVYAVKA